MPAVEPDDNLIIRIPPSEKMLVKDDDSFRPCSSTFSLRTGEEGKSCSIERITTPRTLLDLLRRQNLNPDDGWNVVRLSVADVEELGLRVVSKPTADDQGHCEIINPISPGRISKSLQRKLAKRCSLLTQAKVD